MSELKVPVTDITISDRLSTQLQYEIKIKELSEKLAKVEAELEKYKTVLEVVSDPNSQSHTFTIEVDGKVKKVVVQPSHLDYYLGTSNPINSMVTDLLDLLIGPYRDVIKTELTKKVGAIISNRHIERQGSGL